MLEQVVVGKAWKHPSSHSLSASSYRAVNYRGHTPWPRALWESSRSRENTEYVISQLHCVWPNINRMYEFILFGILRVKELKIQTGSYWQTQSFIHHIGPWSSSSSAGFSLTTYADLRRSGSSISGNSSHSPSLLLPLSLYKRRERWREWRSANIKKTTSRHHILFSHFREYCPSLMGDVAHRVLGNVGESWATSYRDPTIKLGGWGRTV